MARLAVWTSICAILGEVSSTTAGFFVLTGAGDVLEPENTWQPSGSAALRAAAARGLMTTTCSRRCVPRAIASPLKFAFPKCNLTVERIPHDRPAPRVVSELDRCHHRPRDATGGRGALRHRGGEAVVTTCGTTFIPRNPADGQLALGKPTPPPFGKLRMRPFEGGREFPRWASRPRCGQIIAIW